MKFKDIRYDKEGPLAWITLARPESRNAFTPDMFNEIIAAVTDAKAEDSIKVILLACIPTIRM